MLDKIKVFFAKLKVFSKKSKHILTAITNAPMLFFKWMLVIALWGATLLASYLLYVFHNLPSIDTLEEINKTRKVTIVDSSNRVVTTYGDIYGNYIYYHEIPENLKNAVLAIEDKRFFDHWGVSVWSIIRAGIANAKAGHTVQGGSTITQQLAKVVFLSNQRTLKRKIQELLLAVELEQKYTKQQILAIYLNRIYLGAGLYGIDAAAKYYFGKNLKDLNIYESAIIAGLIKAPSKYAPTANPELAGSRAYQVLLSMLEDGYITDKEFQKASSTPVRLNTELLGHSKRNYFTELAYEKSKLINPEDSRDITVRTTYDREIDEICTKTLKAHIDQVRDSNKVSEGAVVVMNYSGEVVGMVGGYNYNKSSFNRATQSYRPAGSAFKVFVYTAAMENGMAIDDLIEDKEIEYGKWMPQNYNRKFHGEMSIEEAFARSINTIAVQLTDKVGVRSVASVARKLGIKSPLTMDLSMALGTSSVNLLEMVGAYGTIANNGYLIEPYTISNIKTTATRTTLFEHNHSAPQQVLSSHASESMQLLLLNAVEYGTGRNALSNFPISGKTGTSQEHRDAWFIGYTDKYIIGVWLGNDNYSPMQKITGGTIPTIIGRDILRQLHKPKK